MRNTLKNTKGENKKQKGGCHEKEGPLLYLSTSTNSLITH